MIVVIATDGSSNANHAIREAARLLPLKQATIFLIAVAPLAAALISTSPVGISYAESFASMAVPQVIDQLELAANLHLDSAMSLLAELGLSATPMERLGEPVDEIIEVAEEVQADLIVVGSHGYGAFQRFLHGSVSDGVAHRAARAVLIVRPAADPEA
jgi:nucleotide-binding universal stress UspA family protein